MARLELLPSVDVAGGRAVDHVEALAGRQRSFGDPLTAALRWQDEGARWVHLVDLDAAFGRGSNAEVIAEVVRAVDIDVEVSGGVRDDATLSAALATGCRRVNVSTAALGNPRWCAEAVAEYADRVAIGLDVKGTRLAARGGTRVVGDLYETLDRLDAAGCRRYVVTDVASDGMMQGPNLRLLRDVCERTDRPVVASGGISTLDDIRRVRKLTPYGVEGAIVGTALHLGAFTLEDALAVAE